MDNEKEAIGLATVVAGIGATAGCGVAALIGAPLAPFALVGGGIACIGAAIAKAKN